MAGSVTLEQVEEMAAQLPPSDRLKLVAHICERLSATPGVGAPHSGHDQHTLQQQERTADELLAELDGIAESIEGEFDAADDIRQMRNVRASSS